MNEPLCIDATTECPVYFDVDSTLFLNELQMEFI